jgi:aminomethyltransferase
MTETATLRRTPLYETHVAAGAKLVPFAGWEMPVHYGSALDEHRATREGAGLFDVSHMGQAAVRGPGAADWVQGIVSRNVAKLTDGRQAYGVLCNEQGGLVDDLIAARLTAEEWLIVINAGTREGDIAEMRRAAGRMGLTGATLTDESDQWAMIAVQGPRWTEAVEGALGAGAWREMKPYRIARMEYAGRPLLVSTTGYTGEKGCELLCAPEVAPQLWRALVDGGGRPIGLAARDSLRLEKGFHLSGVDFTSANSPFEAALEWVVDLEKEFWGVEALRRLKEKGATRRLVGLLPEGRRIPRHGAAIVEGDRAIGEVTSGGFSPALERPVALGYVPLALAAPGSRVIIDLGRGAMAPAEVVKVPFI